MNLHVLFLGGLGVLGGLLVLLGSIRTTDMESCQYCTFYVDNRYFGVEVRQIQEVIRYLELTRVPLASPVVSGLINLRGEIVTAIDLRRRLGLPDRPEGMVPMNVIVRTSDGTVSLLVDEIGEVIQVSADKFEPPPETLWGPARGLIDGAYKLEGQLLLVLNTREVAEVTHTEPLSKSA
jgi:purine-binding chemotaxis protein CheW